MHIPYSHTVVPTIASATLAWIAFASGAIAQSQIQIPVGAPAPVKSAALKLASDLGGQWRVTNGSPGTPGIVVNAAVPLATPESYRLSGSGASTLVIDAGTTAGAVNGIHSLRRRLREAGVPGSPLAGFAFTAPVTTTPNFARRGVMVAPYGFGGQQDLEGFGTDQWGIDEWKAYVDYLRLMNANFLEVFPLRMWSTKHGTFLDKARYDVWKQVLAYCHEVGMEFHYAMLVNQVSSGFWWNNPSLALMVGYQGTASSLLTAMTQTPNPMVAEQMDTYRTFKDADAFVFMWNDGGALDTNPVFTSNPAQGLVTEMLHAHAQLQSVGSNARIVFWGWIHELWINFVQAGSYQTSLSLLSPQSMPFAMEWLTNSDRHLPGSTEPIGAALGHGFVVSDFVYLNNTEDPREMLPHARIQETALEVMNAATRGATGITGYRLSAGTRQINDYVTLRLADDIVLTNSAQQVQSDVRGGLASFLARGNAANATTIDGVLTAIDGAVALGHPPTPWPLYNLLGAQAIASASQTLAGLTPGNPDLDSWRSLVEFQARLFAWADSGLEPNAPTGLGLPSHLETLFNFVLGKPQYRCFTTQHAFTDEGKKALETYMRRVKYPFFY